MLNEVLKSVAILLDKLNRATIKRVLIYFMLSYPLVVTYLYRNEIKMFITFNNDKHINVEISDIAEAQKICFDLRTKYYAETVSLYVYQPTGKNKTHKECMVFSTGQYYVPLESLRNVNLYTRSRILEDLRHHNYSIITPLSKHDESSVLVTYDLAKMIFVAIIDQNTGELIGEVCYVFKNEQQPDINKLIADSQIFSLLIENR
jgi:hypothetical protein